MPDRSPGQVAYEKHVQVFGRTRRAQRWDRLRPNLKARWETIATAVLEACGGSDG
jgi:hypothetical protein